MIDRDAMTGINPELSVQDKGTAFFHNELGFKVSPQIPLNAEIEAPSSNDLSGFVHPEVGVFIGGNGFILEEKSQVSKGDQAVLHITFQIEIKKYNTPFQGANQ